MRPQSPDTDLETERLWFERLSRLSSEQKFRLISAASRAAGELALSGIRTRYPHADESEVRKRWAALTLGREWSLELFGWDPEVEGW
jgi:hypothetical protein